MITHPWCEEGVVNPNNDLIAMFTTPHVTNHLLSISQNENVEVKLVPETKSSVATFSRSKSLRPGLVHTCKDTSVVTKMIVRVMKMMLKIMLVQTIMAKLVIMVIPHELGRGGDGLLHLTGSTGVHEDDLDTPENSSSFSNDIIDLDFPK